jgi:DNA-binding transcriptional LysR family regulator
MDIRQIELLVAVVDLSSVTKAAERMHVSPGAVSLQLHNLAAQLNTELFARKGRQLIPTPAGLRLAEHGRVLIKRMREIRQEFANDPARDDLPFRFATGATTLIHRLGKPLRALRRQYPHTHVEVTVLPTEEIVAGLLDRRFDLGLISLPYPEDRLTVIRLFEEELLVLRPSPRSQTAWRVGTIAVEEVVSAQFLLYPKRSNMRTMIDGFFSSLNVAPEVIMEADDTEAIKRLVESGFGYSMLPEFALRPKPRFFETFRVAGRRLVRTQALAMAQSEYPRALTSSIASFLEQQIHLEQHVEQQNGAGRQTEKRKRISYA